MANSTNLVVLSGYIGSVSDTRHTPNEKSVMDFSIAVNNMSNTSKTDWTRIDAMTEAEIDTSDIPPLSEEFFASATLRLPSKFLSQSVVSVPVDNDTLHWFQAQDREFEKCMAAALRIYAQTYQANQVAK